MEVFTQNSFILVGIIPSPKDREIARMLGWYRIPFKFAPKIIDVDYFAFYQGANFGEQHRWRVEYIAEYRGHELTTRRELFRDEPNHPRANEEYYKVQIGPLVKLPSPIIAEKWKRITFLYTTGELFNQARIINDLVVRSDDREVLWKNLREHSWNSQLYQTRTEMEIPVDPLLLDLIFGLDSQPHEDDLENY